MNKRITPFVRGLAVLGVLLLSACSSAVGPTEVAAPPSRMMETTDPGSMMGTQAGNVPVTGEEVDEMFINMMVPHHQGAVAMAQITLERAGHAEIKEMANAIITSQEDEITQMKDWKQQWYGSSETPPMSEMPMLQEMPGMGSGGHLMNMQADVDALRDAPEPFDLAFIDAMIPHHQSAVDAAMMVKDTAVHPEIRTLAQQVIEAQQQEIDQLKTWRQEWYPDVPPPGNLY